MERVLRKIMEDGKVVDETENPPAGLLLSVRREEEGWNTCSFPRRRP